MIRKIIAPLVLTLGLVSGAALATEVPATTAQQKTYQGKVIGASEQVTIGDNNHPAVTLRIQFAADGKLAAGLPVTVNIDDN